MEPAVTDFEWEKLLHDVASILPPFCSMAKCSVGEPKVEALGSPWEEAQCPIQLALEESQVSLWE